MDYKNIYEAERNILATVEKCCIKVEADHFIFILHLFNDESERETFRGREKGRGSMEISSSAGGY